MSRRPGARSALITLALLLAAGSSSAALTDLEVFERSPVAGGKRYGPAGRYEKLSGRLHFAADPADPANSAIRDIAYAATNAEGMVEFSADFYLLKPVDMSRASGTLLFEVSNRGRKGLLSMFAGAPGSLDPAGPDAAGDAFFHERGDVLLWVGWQFDVPSQPGLLRSYVPLAEGISGFARSDFVTRTRVDGFALGDRDHIGYAADLSADGATLTVRDRPDGKRSVVPREDWSFARIENGRQVADRRHVTVEGGLEPNRIYEIVYPSQSPPIAGFGLAAVRDAVTQLRHDGEESLGIAAADIDAAVAFGLSQSGRMLRQFLYDGFNTDEADRRVFDGMMIHIAAGSRGSFNHRFAQASRASWSFLYPNAIFPFSDLNQTDPLTGRTDGLLEGISPAHRPRIIYTNSSNEYWRGNAALTHVSVDGKQDLNLPDGVRSYLLAGTQHVPARFPSEPAQGQLAANTNPYRWFMRTLYLALNDWVRGDGEPPPSKVPTLADGTLVRRDALDFPEIRGVDVPERLAPARAIDFGPDFDSSGIIENEPPVAGASYPLLLPQVDIDGNEVAGLRSPALGVPLGTYTGWNLYADPFGPTDEMISLQGGYVPFARDEHDVRGRGDPRATVAARYAGRSEFLARVAEYSDLLIATGYLLEQDLDAIIEDAGHRWDYAVGGAAD